MQASELDNACGRFTLNERLRLGDLVWLGGRAALPDIYVQIPAYRDRELANTLRSLYRHAASPRKLRVRVMWQHGPDERLPVDVLRLPNLEIDAVPAADSQGCNWARRRLQSCWAGERLTLFLDSHHRFVAGWDRLAVDMLEGLRSQGCAKPLLTAYLPGYDPADPNRRRRHPFKIYPLEREDGVLTRLMSMPIIGWRDLRAPIPADFVSLHFLLADGRFNIDVPMDPSIYFFGDEVHLSLRAFAAGYRLFHPHRVLGWHAYDRSARTPHWADHSDWATRNARSLRKLKRLYRSKKPLGSTDAQRCTVADFERHTGVKLVLQ